MNNNSSKSSSSRLDRLILLLEKGSNKNIKLAAAKQIGSIQLAIDDVRYLIRRVKNLLYHSEWEVRIASGEAIEAICANIDLFTPKSNIDMKEDLLMDDVSTEILYSFKTYDFQKELESGNELLGQSKSKTSAPKKRAAPKRPPKKNVKEIPPKIVKIDNNNTNVNNTNNNITQNTISSQLVSIINPGEKLSKRVMAMRKRKERMEQQKKEKSSFGKDSSEEDNTNLLMGGTSSKKRKTEEDITITEQPQDSNKIVMESTMQEPTKEDKNWPFHSFIVEFLNNLKSEDWIKRHGAAIGLRSILRKHAVRCGMKNGKTVEEQKRTNELFLENICVRLFSVFALDKFGDYVSDRMIAPIPETCAQILPYLLIHMNADQMVDVLKVSMYLIESKEWQVRLSGFTALKYVTISRDDILKVKSVFSKVLESVIKGLKDNQDEVISVSAETLIPILEEVFKSQTKGELLKLIDILWNLISSLDDLSISTVNIMKSLTKIYSYLGNQLDTLSSSSHSLVKFFPKIWKFFRHNIEPVREQVLFMISKLVEISPPQNWLIPNFKDTISFVFDNLLLEQTPEILNTNISIWRKIVEKMSNDTSISEITFYNIENWLRILTTKTDTIFVRDLFTYKRIFAKKKKGDSDCVSDREKNSISCQKTASKALGFLLSHCPTENRQNILGFLLGKMRESNLVEEKVTISMIFLEYLKKRKEDVFVKEIEFELWNVVEKKGETIPWLPETFPLQQTLMNCFRDLHIFLHTSNELPQHIQINNNTPMTIELMQQLSQYCTLKVDNTPVENKQNQFVIKLNQYNQAFIKTVTELEKCQNKSILNLISSFSQVLVFGDISNRKESILHCLKEAVFNDTNSVSQKRSAKAIAYFIHKHLESFDQQIDLDFLFSCIFQNLCKTKQNKNNSTRGCKYILQYLPKIFGDKLFVQIPQLSQRFDFNVESIDDKERLEYVDNTLKILITITPFLTSLLKDQIVNLLKLILDLTKLGNDEINSSVSILIPIICENSVSLSMVILIDHLIPFITCNDESLRLSSIKILEEIIKKMDFSIVPFLVYFVFPVLSRLSDHNSNIRKKAAFCFAKLVRLMPLEEGSELPPTFPERLALQRKEKRSFLQQLLDGKKLDKFEMPIPIKGAILRSYQQDGLNWLAFLNKYNLNGILCDDMGLGKTLQTLSIIAADHHNKKQKYIETNSPEHKPLPTLIICPPTLMPHWASEAVKFFPGSFRCFEYNPKRKNFTAEHNLIITSYRTVTTDIDFLSKVSFNYCILDEGHVIKNSSSKTGSAVKSIKANHKLILSGTPIQNNVLELWSLFDFLMPGFLGTEKQFNQTYSKPIQQSRFAKNEKEEEAGVLALDSLHKQVLPFLLRRLKENVLSDLPPKIIQDYYCKLTNLQLKLYQDFSQTGKEGVLEDSKEEVEKKTTTFQSLLYLRKLCNHPCLVLTAKHPEYNSIMSALKKEGKSLESVEYSGKLLALEQLLLECGIGVTSNNTNNNNNKNMLSSTNKLSTSIDTSEVENTQTFAKHRALVFFQMNDTMQIVEEQLLKRKMPNVTYLVMNSKQSPKERFNVANLFNSDPTIDLLLLTTQIGGLGLTLTGADTVIFVEHDWNPTKDLQAMDRAHRLGQTKVVNVYRLITQGTLEEKIMSLQQFKTKTTNAVINEENSSLASMDTSRLLDLFECSTKNEIVENKVSENEENDGSVSGSVGVPAPGLKGLTELWDDKDQYEEFSLDNFISKLKKK